MSGSTHAGVPKSALAASTLRLIRLKSALCTRSSHRSRSRSSFCSSGVRIFFVAVRCCCAVVVFVALVVVVVIIMVIMVVVVGCGCCCCDQSAAVVVFIAFFLLHVHVQQRLPRAFDSVKKAKANRACSRRTRACYSSTTRHSAMVPTAASPSAQPAIVKIRRVDALIPLIRAATTTTTTCLYAFTALLLLVEGADKYTAIAPSSP
jgi:hypothetical protein